MNPIQQILILAVRIYRWTFSPAMTFLFGPYSQCRFTPSCSEYALDSIGKHGAVVGCWLAIKRVCRCHPWGDCGHDPVPDPEVQSSRFKVQSLDYNCSEERELFPKPAVFIRSGLGTNH